MARTKEKYEREAMSDELTREQIEKWRFWLLERRDSLDVAREANALCDLALRALSDHAEAGQPQPEREMVKEWRELRTHYSHPAAVLAWADNAAALLSQPKPELGGEGEVVVPREPTEEMKEAWNYACRDMPGCAWWEPSYRAMLDAAMLAKDRT